MVPAPTMPNPYPLIRVRSLAVFSAHPTARWSRAVGAVRDNTSMQLYRDYGVVLRTQKLGEADHIVTVLARKTGKVRAVATDVRRTRPRFGGRLEPFTHVDLLLSQGRSRHTITQAEVIRSYGAPLTA